MRPFVVLLSSCVCGVAAYRPLKSGDCLKLAPLTEKPTAQDLLAEHKPGEIMQLGHMNVFDAAALEGKDVLIFAINGECPFDAKSLAPVRKRFAQALVSRLCRNKMNVCHNCSLHPARVAERHSRRDLCHEHIKFGKTYQICLETPKYSQTGINE